MTPPDSVPCRGCCRSFDWTIEAAHPPDRVAWLDNEGEIALHRPWRGAGPERADRDPDLQARKLSFPILATVSPKWMRYRKYRVGAKASALLTGEIFATREDSRPRRRTNTSRQVRCAGKLDSPRSHEDCTMQLNGRDDSGLWGPSCLRGEILKLKRHAGAPA